MDAKNIESGVAKVVVAPEASPVAARPADATKLVTPGSSGRRPTPGGRREREGDPLRQARARDVRSDEARREAAAKRAAAAERERAERR